METVNTVLEKNLQGAGGHGVHLGHGEVHCLVLE